MNKGIYLLIVCMVALANTTHAMEQVTGGGANTDLGDVDKELYASEEEKKRGDDTVQPQEYKKGVLASLYKKGKSAYKATFNFIGHNHYYKLGLGMVVAMGTYGGMRWLTDRDFTIENHGFCGEAWFIENNPLHSRLISGTVALGAGYLGSYFSRIATGVCVVGLWKGILNTSFKNVAIRKT